MDLNKASGGGTIRVFVADNSPIHTQLLADALRRDAGMEVIRPVSESSSLIAEIMASDIDVLVISSSLEDQPGRGFEILHELRCSFPGLRAVVLVDSSKRELIVEAFRAGARGIFSRQSSVEMLSKCVHSVQQGQIWADSRETSLAVEALADSHAIRAGNGNGLSLLSKREMEVVHCLAEGLTNREIAHRLGLSQHTIKNYLFRVFDKLGVSSRVELLFMTLSQSSLDRRDFADLVANSLNSDPKDAESLAFCKKEAEQGVVVAQLALAQMYWARRSNPENMTQAYMWYSIAAERVASEKAKIAKAIPAELRIEAEQRVAQWRHRTQATGPASVESPRKSRATVPPTRISLA
jgi:two-component system, NarL family, nitrate/nitrite response regulator NarL